VTSSPTIPGSPVRQALLRLSRGARLDDALVAAAFAQVMRGEASPAEAAGLLMGLRVQGETANEIAGAVRALRAAMVQVPAVEGPLIDTCGTGGGTVPTFNVSTAAAFVAVAAGARVAKHGNRSHTSRCGSADLMEALGIDLMIDADRAAALLERAGMAFLFAPAFHPAMKHLGPVRHALGVPTIMNLIGPLVNPAGVTRQVIGVADAERAPVIAAALARLDMEHALVVHAAVGMDEIAPSGPTLVWEVRGDRVDATQVDPASIGLAHDDLAALAGGDPAENADRIRRLFERPDDDPAGFAAVALNAGAAIYVAGLADDLRAGTERAVDAMRRGAAAEALERLVREGGVSTS